MLSNSTYDLLKKIAQYWIPAAGSLYFALSQIWGFPYGEQIVGTLAVTSSFLGVVLGYSTSQYKKELMKTDSR